MILFVKVGTFSVQHFSKIFNGLGEVVLLKFPAFSKKYKFTAFLLFLFCYVSIKIILEYYFEVKSKTKLDFNIWWWWWWWWIFSVVWMTDERRWLNGWMFVYELSGCGFDSHCSHLSVCVLYVLPEVATLSNLVTIGLAKMEI